jgi:hypothetical protein
MQVLRLKANDHAAMQLLLFIYLFLLAATLSTNKAMMTMNHASFPVPFELIRHASSISHPSWRVCRNLHIFVGTSFFPSSHSFHHF